jgi:solute carrier family 10 (sodium/bile acid cotransporter), member 7
MTRIFPDRFVLLLFGTVLLGWLLPAKGGFLDIARQLSNISIFALFFLHGLRLPRRDVVAAARSWKLQSAMLLFVFGVMPLAGLILFKSVGWMLPAALGTGLLYCAMLPSTVQSAISYSSIAGGNVAGSVIGAAVSNLAGIVLTPLLVALVLGATSGISLGGDVFLRIATMLLLPFVLGQVAQNWFGAWAQRQKAMLSFFDRLVILIAVYVAFAGAVASGGLAALDLATLTVLGAVLGLLLAFALAGAWFGGGVIGLARVDRISLTFAGSHKSIATGAPMAAILFGSGAGLIVLPAIIYHLMQLLASAPLAARLAKGS